MPLTGQMGQQVRNELSRIVDAAGAGAADARLALGDGPIGQRLAAAVRALAIHRGPGSSTCPSDAARIVGGENWRELMDSAREVARELARSGEVEITQGGRAVDPDGEWRGPIRIRVTRRAR
ncbi:hypothetical protein HLY00_1987 [Mycolicibacterium hippocampi]|uniref:DUF3253 domain-containing protein n=2 Tax=Mycobacteriaceae TaxID=1762 RepID=A0A850PVI0_9MYCO|nr:hypothetical protein [Mycolicibacterium hippocampi]